MGILGRIILENVAECAVGKVIDKKANEDVQRMAQVGL